MIWLQNYKKNQRKEKKLFKFRLSSVGLKKLPQIFTD